MKSSTLFVSRSLIQICPTRTLLGSSMDLRFLDAPSKPPALEAYAAQTWKDLWVKGSRPGCQGGGDGTGKSEALEMRS